MPNKMKYSEKQLCEAVKKYAEEHKGKIKASEVALWARETLSMEEVRGYHFLRPKVVKADGKKQEEKRECTKLLEDINKRRAQLFATENNVILKAVAIDDFFSLPMSEQRKSIAAVREYVKDMTKANLRLQVENDVVRRERQAVEKRMEELYEQIEKVAKETARTMRLCKYIANRLADKNCIEICGEIGIEDGNLDLQKFEESIHDFDAVSLDFRDVLRKYSIETSREAMERILDETLFEIREFVHGGDKDC